ESMGDGRRLSFGGEVEEGTGVLPALSSRRQLSAHEDRKSKALRQGWCSTYSSAFVASLASPFLPPKIFFSVKPLCEAPWPSFPFVGEASLGCCALVAATSDPSFSPSSSRVSWSLGSS